MLLSSALPFGVYWQILLLKKINQEQTAIWYNSFFLKFENTLLIL